MTPAQKRLAFPLCGPRWQTLAWSPVHLLSVAVDAYHTAFFMALTPKGHQ